MTKDELIDQLQIKNIQLTKALEVAESALKEIITHVKPHPDGLDGRFSETKSTIHALGALDQINRIKNENS